MLKKINGVVLELNETEREAMDDILRLASVSLAEGVPLGRRRILHAGAMIQALRDALDLPEEPEATPEEHREAVRALIARQRNSAFVNSEGVLCAYDRCGERFHGTQDGSLSVWEQARARGWTVVWPDDARSTDLYCPGPHDKHGNRVYPD